MLLIYLRMMYFCFNSIYWSSSAFFRDLMCIHRALRVWMLISYYASGFVGALQLPHVCVLLEFIQMSRIMMWPIQPSPDRKKNIVSTRVITAWNNRLTWRQKERKKNNCTSKFKKKKKPKYCFELMRRLIEL